MGVICRNLSNFVEQSRTVSNFVEQCREQCSAVWQYAFASAAANELASDARCEAATANTLQQKLEEQKLEEQKLEEQKLEEQALQPEQIQWFMSLCQNQLFTATDFGCRVTNRVSAICQQELCRCGLHRRELTAS